MMKYGGQIFAQEILLPCSAFITVSVLQMGSQVVESDTFRNNVLQVFAQNSQKKVTCSNIPCENRFKPFIYPYLLAYKLFNKIC